MFYSSKSLVRPARMHVPAGATPKQVEDLGRASIYTSLQQAGCCSIKKRKLNKMEPTQAIVYTSTVSFCWRWPACKNTRRGDTACTQCSKGRYAMQDKPSPIKKCIEAMLDERDAKWEARFKALEKDNVRALEELKLHKRLHLISTATLQECELLLLSARVVCFSVGVALLSGNCPGDCGKV